MTYVYQLLLGLAAEGPQLAYGWVIFSLPLHTKLSSGLVGLPFLAMKHFCLPLTNNWDKLSEICY